MPKGAGRLRRNSACDMSAAGSSASLRLRPGLPVPILRHCPADPPFFRASRAEGEVADGWLGRILVTTPSAYYHGHNNAPYLATRAKNLNINKNKTYNKEGEIQIVSWDRVKGDREKDRPWDAVASNGGGGFLRSFGPQTITNHTSRYRRTSFPCPQARCQTALTCGTGRSGRTTPFNQMGKRIGQGPKGNPRGENGGLEPGGRQDPP